ncbi:hypothetical protein GGF48_004598, partial [Coemansia sp. RSA 921]
MDIETSASAASGAFFAAAAAPAARARDAAVGAVRREPVVRDAGLAGTTDDVGARVAERAATAAAARARDAAVDATGTPPVIDRVTGRGETMLAPGAGATALRAGDAGAPLAVPRAATRRVAVGVVAAGSGLTRVAVVPAFSGAARDEALELAALKVDRASGRVALVTGRTSGRDALAATRVRVTGPDARVGVTGVAPGLAEPADPTGALVGVVRDAPSEVLRATLGAAELDAAAGLTDDGLADDGVADDGVADDGVACETRAADRVVTLGVA